MKPSEWREQEPPTPEFPEVEHPVNGKYAEPDLISEASGIGTLDVCYTPEFIERVANASKGQIFEIRDLFKKKFKDFSPERFRTLWKEAVRRRPVVFGEDSAWRALLISTDKGSPRAMLANAITAIRHAPEWDGVLAYNELACRTVKLKPPPFSKPSIGFWNDADDVFFSDWLQRSEINVGISIAAAAAQAVSTETRFHPIREYLSDLEWDGESRITSWLTRYMGVNRTAYTEAVGAKWLISAVARVIRPGCQVDTCLVLEGEQGIRKSGALRELTGDTFFADQMADLDNKDSSQDLIGKWILEIKEIDKLSKHEMGVIKSYMDRRSDHYRPSYGRRSEDFPRQCIFGATTNKGTYFQDETGNRRWWPVYCNEIDLAAIGRDRDQLWAEAYAAYQEGRSWWLEDQSIIAQATAEQEDRVDTDVWDEKIWEWVLEQKSLCSKEEYTLQINEILDICLKKPLGSWTTSEKYRVARILKFHGMIRYQIRSDEEPQFDDGTGPRRAKSLTRREWRYKFPA